ncbi:WD40/YVTN/BNR-like repeat-containing protein [Terriglobus sp. YAF25]|uniref:WD40/YVTN/BNR-like repeat-containing protein n=1 Tax=Terriglobus sp. YAF25 TaxID=3233080 RepID=UPI003F9E1FE2
MKPSSYYLYYLGAALAMGVCCSSPAQNAAQWTPYGPGGGDARSFAQDPSDHNHVYLGTVLGTVYESRDGGRSWVRLTQIENRDDLALDNMVVDRSDPRHLVVGAWVLGNTDGGVYVSHDGGRTFAANAAMKGRSVRALSAAPSEAKVLVAGALDGVYRSEDGGDTWNRISPVENKEIHEVESIAIDPTDPKTIYAGTWHLPWKTAR